MLLLCCLKWNLLIQANIHRFSFYIRKSGLYLIFLMFQKEEGKNMDLLGLDGTPFNDNQCTEALLDK